MRAFAFEGFLLTDELTYRGRPVQLEPKPLAVLRCLLENSDKRVPLEELRLSVWGNASVGAASVHTAVSALRRVLDGAALISNKRDAGFRIHVDLQLPRNRMNPKTWPLYAAHTVGTVAERIAAADQLALAESERFGA